MPRNAQSFIVTRVDAPSQPGAICFTRHPDGGIVGFSHVCPCGCGKWSFIRLNPELWEPGSRTPMWQRTGDDLHMTLTPSIGIHPQTNGVWHWHGYLRNGVFEEC